LSRRTVEISRKQKRKLGKTLPYIIPITYAAAFSAAEKAMILIASKKHNYSSMSVLFCVQYNLKIVCLYPGTSIFIFYKVWATAIWLHHLNVYGEIFKN